VQELQTPGQAQRNEETVQFALDVAERLRGLSGADLDDEAISAVAEATGAPTAYVRAALLRHKHTKRQGLAAQIKNVLLSLEPDTRRFVGSSLAASLLAIAEVLKLQSTDPTGFYGVAQIIVGAFAAWNIALSRDRRIAAISGAILGGFSFTGASLFALLARIPYHTDSFLLIPWTLGGAAFGLLMHTLINRNKGRLGLVDPQEERQELLRQMMALQAKLEQGKQSATFLSLDVAGSTRMKQLASPLEVEYTFNEYHSFVEMITRRHGGRVHSTAGDGVICAFDSPQQAFAAAKNIQVGMIELNAFRNTIGVPLKLRAGIHSGDVVAPGADIKSVNFAHVIDIASHLQKVAPEGGIAISRHAAVQLAGGPESVGSESVRALDVEAVIWAPRAAPVQSSTESPPPPPV
jgi:class 3 adenylate cyclase